MKTYQPEILPVNIAISSNWQDFVDFFTCQDGSNIPALEEDVSLRGRTFVAFHDGYRWECLYLPRGSSIEIIAHEAFHVAQSALENLQIHYISNDSNEIFAYFIGYIARISRDFLGE